MPAANGRLSLQHQTHALIHKIYWLGVRMRAAPASLDTTGNIADDTTDTATIAQFKPGHSMGAAGGAAIVCTSPAAGRALHPAPTQWHL